MLLEAVDDSELFDALLERAARGLCFASNRPAEEWPEYRVEAIGFIAWEMSGRVTKAELARIGVVPTPLYFPTVKGP